MALASSTFLFLPSSSPEWGACTSSSGTTCSNGAAILRIRASSSDGGLRRPGAPAARPPAPPLEPSPSTSSPTTVSPSIGKPVGDPLFTGITIEFQRQRAKELQEFFLDKKYEEQAAKGRIFGLTQKNEVGNGRWAMFGFAVGLLTEFATGVDFIEQLKIIGANLGIVD